MCDQTATGFSSPVELEFVTIGKAIIIAKEDGSLETINDAGYLMRILQVGNIHPLFGMSCADAYYIFYADGMSLVRLNVMTGDTITIKIDPECFNAPTGGAAISPDEFVLFCGSRDLILFKDTEIMRCHSVYFPITKFAASVGRVLIIQAGDLHVLDSGFNEESIIRRASLPFNPEHMAVNGDLLLITNGTDGARCNFEPGKPCEFHTFTLPFAPTCIKPYSTDLFACGTASGIEVCVLFLVCVCVVHSNVCADCGPAEAVICAAETVFDP